jgi:hypothetical protein
MHFLFNHLSPNLIAVVLLPTPLKHLIKGGVNCIAYAALLKQMLTQSLMMHPETSPERWKLIRHWQG